MTGGTLDQDPPAPEGKPDAPPVQVPPRKHRRRIRTLNPDRLAPDDYLDLGSKHQPSLRVILRSTDRPACLVRLHASPSEWSSGVFPAGSHGFLHYHVPPNGSPLAGELRFRITHSRDPASFATGSDLLTEHGMPWEYPLYKIVSRPDFREIVALLLQDGLVSQRTLDLVAAATASLRASARIARVTDVLRMTPSALSAFGQEFVYCFGVHSVSRCLFVGPDSIFRHDTKYFTSFPVRTGGKHKSVQYFPFEGSVVASFERSTLPEHAGRRVVVMRIKRLCDSDPIRDVPAPDGRIYPVEALRPREGQLAQTMVHGRVRPWAVDVDKGWKSRGVLKVLFENEELYGSPRES